MQRPRSGRERGGHEEPFCLERAKCAQGGLWNGAWSSHQGQRECGRA